MAKVTGEIVIERPVDVVFDFVADQTNEPAYNPAMLQSGKLTQGPVAVGTRFKAVHSSRRGPVEMVVTVTEFERPRLMASTTTMPMADVSGVLTFEPSEDGTCLRWSWDIEPRGMLKICAPLVSMIGRHQERSCWEGLKRYLEGQADSARRSSAS